jgi:WD40 repeat protein
MPALPPGSVALQLRGQTCAAGSPGSLYRIVALPDGSRIATAGADASVYIFSVATGEHLRTLTGHTAAVHSLAALGGDLIASGDADGGLRVWNARSGERGGALTHSPAAPISSLAALGASRLIAGASSDVLLLTHRGGRDVTMSQRVTHAHSGSVSDVAVCAQTARLATCGRCTAGSDATAAVWDAESLSQLAVLRGHACPVLGVALSARWVVTCASDGALRLYSARTFACARVLSAVHSDSAWSVSLVGGDHVLSASYDGTVCLSSAETGAVAARVELPFYVYAAAVVRDGRLAAAGQAGRAALVPALAAAARVVLGHNAAAHPGLTLRALGAIEAGAHPSVLRRALVGRRVTGGRTGRVDALWWH